MNISRFLKNDLFSALIFLYFFTLHADKLNVVISGYTLRVSNLLSLILTVLFLIRFRFNLLIFNKKFVYALLLIFFSIALSAMQSPYKARCFIHFGWFGWTVFCYVLLPYFLIKLGDARHIFSLYLGSFLVVGCYALFQLLLSLFGYQDPFVDQFFGNFCARPNAFCFEPSYYALYMTPFIFMYNTYFLSYRPESFFLFRKPSLAQALLINLLYLISTSSAVFFAYLLFFFLAFFFKTIDHRRLVRFIVTFGGVGMSLFLLIPFIVKDVLLKFFYHGFMSHHSFLERWHGLMNGWKIFLKHPFLGVGLGGYPCYLMDSYLKGDKEFTFCKMHALIGEFYNPVKLFDAMNVTTELLASLGLIGLMAFVLPLLLFFRLVQKLDWHDSKVPSMVMSLLITLFVVQFSQGLLRTYLWVHFTIIFAYVEKENAHQNAAINHHIA